MSQRSKSRGRIPVFFWIILALLALALAYRLVRPGTAHAQHPEPRPGITAARVQAPGQWSDQPDVAEVYRMAAEIPGVLDGLYCYCDCHHNFGHRSLLDCFQSDHGGNCDVCMGEVRIAYRMHRDGKSLQQIRQVIDATYGKGG